jgi:hypothetical protein
MSVFLYRAICLEHADDAFTGEALLWPGLPLGRSSGYLSRSSAVVAGQRSGVEFKVVRSSPVKFPALPEVELAEAREQISVLRSQLGELVTS